MTRGKLLNTVERRNCWKLQRVWNSVKKIRGHRLPVISYTKTVSFGDIFFGGSYLPGPRNNQCSMEVWWNHYVACYINKFGIIKNKTFFRTSWLEGFQVYILVWCIPPPSNSVTVKFVKASDALLKIEYSWWSLILGRGYRIHLTYSINTLEPPLGHASPHALKTLSVMHCRFRSKWCLSGIGGLIWTSSE